MITENLSTLTIHKLTQEQYNRERTAGRLDSNAIYLVPEEKTNNGGGGSVGADGVGIAKIEQTTTSTLDGGTNVITVTLTDGTSSTFNVKNGSKGSNGVGIADIVKTSTNGLIDTYTIYFDNDTSTTFQVTNGKDAESGVTRQDLEGAIHDYENNVAKEKYQKKLYKTDVFMLGKGAPLEGGGAIDFYVSYSILGTSQLTSVNAGAFNQHNSPETALPASGIVYIKDGENGEIYLKKLIHGIYYTKYTLSGITYFKCYCVSSKINDLNDQSVNIYLGDNTLLFDTFDYRTGDLTGKLTETINSYVVT